MCTLLAAGMKCERGGALHSDATSCSRTQGNVGSEDPAAPSETEWNVQADLQCLRSTIHTGAIDQKWDCELATDAEQGQQQQAFRRADTQLEGGYPRHRA